MNVLVDRHHAGLYHSLQLLAQRLGWSLYTPIGHEWWDEWYWAFGRGFGDDRLARQYLSFDGWTDTGTWLTEDGEFPGWPIHGVTLEQARGMDWTYAMASVQDNQGGFAKFARESGATYLYQVGNTAQQVNWKLNPIALVSSEVPILGRGVLYHQEMDPVSYHPSRGEGTASFVNCMPSMGRCWDLLSQAQASGADITVYGIDGAAGIVKPYARLIELMAGARWGWHDKAHGDGFGHVIHSWAAVGRPLVGHASHYSGRMAAPLWEDGVTCIDLDHHPIPEALRLMDDLDAAAMGRALRDRFESLIDYEAEAEQIRALLA